MSENVATLVRYRLAPDESQFTVQAFAGGLLNVLGHDPVIAVRDFAGEAEFMPGTLADAKLRVTIRADSLAVTGDIKEKDRAEIEQKTREEVLEAATYPEIVFESTSVTANRIKEGRYRVRVIGNLQLHGVTQNNVWLHAEVSVSEDSLRAQGEHTLKHTDFKLKQVSVAGGALKVKNEVKISFDIVGSKQ